MNTNEVVLADIFNQITDRVKTSIHDEVQNLIQEAVHNEILSLLGKLVDAPTKEFVGEITAAPVELNPEVHVDGIPHRIFPYAKRVVVDWQSCGGDQDEERALFFRILDEAADRGHAVHNAMALKRIGGDFNGAYQRSHRLFGSWKCAVEAYELHREGAL